MLGQYLDKAQLDEIDALVQSLSAYLQHSVPMERSSIFVLSQWQWIAMPIDERDLCRRPLLYREAEIACFYRKLQAAHEKNTEKIDAAVSLLSEFGIDHSHSRPLIRYAQFYGRAIEVWMCTISVSIYLEIQPGVQQVWNFLRNSESLLPEACQYLGKLIDLAETVANLVNASPFPKHGACYMPKHEGKINPIIPVI